MHARFFNSTVTDSIGVVIQVFVFSFQQISRVQAVLEKKPKEELMLT